MLGLMLIFLALSSVELSPAPRILKDSKYEVVADPLDPVFGFAREESTLNEMFREVEELMEDTQLKLKHAVQEMEVEEDGADETGPDVEPGMLPLNYHNESNTETKVGNETVLIHQEIDKLTDNQTGSTMYSESVISSVKGGEGRRNHCSRDGECCDEEVCAWGFCTNAISKGENGTLCETQQDCNAGLCCAVQPNSLFPVCTPLPTEGEKCHDSSSNLLDVITWEMESERVLDRCPCATGLTCQLQNDDLVSVCQQSSISEETRINGKEDVLEMEDIPIFSAIPIEAVNDYDKIKIIEAMNNELEDMEKDISETTDLQEPDVPYPNLDSDV
ncbi:dickkopf-related protein 3 isoform X2 [Pleurodeles waltl]|uniref:dickkopf-related protein 3 isoform X2 n=1 Tax=Pleurodeles waltl TaxID=8319 RepID=UPI0037095F66